MQVIWDLYFVIFICDLVNIYNYIIFILCILNAEAFDLTAANFVIIYPPISTFISPITVSVLFNSNGPPSFLIVWCIILFFNINSYVSLNIQTVCLNKQTISTYVTNILIFLNPFWNHAIIKKSMFFKNPKLFGQNLLICLFGI